MKIIPMLLLVAFMTQNAYAVNKVAHREKLHKDILDFLNHEKCDDIPEGQLKEICIKHSQKKLTPDELHQAIEGFIDSGTCTDLPPSRRGRLEKACEYQQKNKT